MNPIRDGKPIRRSTDLQARAKVVAWAMLDVGQGKGNMVTISLSHLQAETGQARNTVRSGLDELLSAGWFRQVSEGQRDHQPAVYKWQGAQLPLFANRVKGEPSNRVKVEPGQGTSNWVNMRAQLGQTGVHNSKNKLRTRTKTCAAHAAKPSAKAKKTNPNHKPFTDYFCFAWQAKFGSVYPYQRGKDSLAVTNILGALQNDMPKGRRLTDAYLKLEGWAAKQGHKLSVMPSCLAELIAGSQNYDTDQYGNPDGSKAKRGRLR